jgi:hypothetical protein
MEAVSVGTCLTDSVAGADSTKRTTWEAEFTLRDIKTIGACIGAGSILEQKITIGTSDTHSLERSCRVKAVKAVGKLRIAGDADGWI